MAAHTTDDLAWYHHVMATATHEIASLLYSRDGYRQGRPCLRGTGITVHQIAAAHSLGYTAEELCAQNSDLDPSLIYAALAHYFANRALIESDLDRDRDAGTLLAAQPTDSR